MTLRANPLPTIVPQIRFTARLAYLTYIDLYRAKILTTVPWARRVLGAPRTRFGQPRTRRVHC